MSSDKYSITRGLYLTREQHKIMETMIEAQAQEVEKGREPNRIYKFVARAFVNKEFSIRFENGQPVMVRYQNAELGPACLYRKSPLDVKYDVPQLPKFEKFRLEQRNFLLTVDFGGDGCCYIKAIKAYGVFNKYLDEFGSVE